MARIYTDQERRERHLHGMKKLYAKRRSDGLCVECATRNPSKGCVCDQCGERIRHNRRAWYKRNRLKILASQKVLYEKRKTVGACIRCSDRSETGMAMCAECAKHENSLVKVRSRTEPYQKKRAARQRHRRKTDIQCWLADRLRVRIGRLMRGERKEASAVRDLGCSLDELKRHLESKFTEGMGWDSRGVKWHIDHIKPLRSFDLTDRNEFLRAVHYTNLQPLWASDNIRKRAKWIQA